MPPLQLFFNYDTSLLLILFRVSATLLMIPVIGDQGVPGPVKRWLAVAIAVVLVPVVHLGPAPRDVVSLSVGILGELFIGALIGLGAQVLFAAIQFGSELMGLQMGFGVATLIDPASAQSTPLIQTFYTLLAGLLLFETNAHHMMLRAMVRSFEVVPPLGVSPGSYPVDRIVRLTGEMFALGMRIAAPLILVLLLANGALGILSRVVPQINVWMLGFSITIGLGFLIMGASLSLFAGLVEDRMNDLGGVVSSLLMAIRSP